MKLSILSAISFLLFSCGNETQKSKNSIETVVKQSSKMDELKIAASRLRGGGSIKSIELVGETVNIIYVSSYEEYKRLNPQSILTETDLSTYWESGDAIQKALIDGAVRIMKKLNFVNEVSIVLPYKNEVYEIFVVKSELEKFIGKDFETILKNWDELFSDPYVYDKEGRHKFFQKFGKK
ncbi:hypothetical protein [Sphingobacterium sp. UBA6320]|uniref:hypothetical protein n=1 Tax=Sphingobacterium sp. UBA6320 TaxID=1947510 RepID=UPI0025E0E828|nr:hypothetical protein [Sphingobacterium sp. UBA6320]